MLSEAIRAGVGRAGRLIAIEGQAGIGKTRLLSTARDLAAEAGMRVLSARGSTLERSFAYGVVRQLFEPVLARISASDKADFLGGAAAFARPLFEERAVKPTSPASQEGMGAVLHGLFWLTANLAERQSLFVTIDDAHWSDTPSLEWLGYLLRRIEGLPVLVAVALRPTDPGAETVLLEELRKDPLCTILRPVPLSAQATTCLVENMLGANPAQLFCLACHQATGGNPLLLRQLLDALSRAGVSPTAAEVPRVHEIGPSAVSHLVQLRLSQLPASARWFVRALAVLGDGSDLETVAALAGIDPSTAADAAGILAEIDVLHDDPRLSFVHPLVREAVYAEVRPSERQAAHARAAEILAERGNPPERVAAHLLLVPPGRHPLAVEILRSAADRALMRSAPGNAANYLRRALEEAMATEERGELLRRLGAAETLIRAPEAERHLREALAITTDPYARAEIELTLARFLFWKQETTAAVEVLEQAIARAPDAPPDLRKRLEAELVGIDLSDVATHATGARRLSQMPEPTAETMGGKILLAFAAYLDTYRGIDRERCVERAQQALAGDALFIEEEASMSCLAARIVLLYADRLDLYERASDRLRSLAKDRGAAASFAFGSAGLARVLADRGLLHEAEAEARTGLGACPDGQPIVKAYVGSMLAYVLLKRGDLDGAAAALVQGGLDRGDPPRSLHTLIPVAFRGRLHLAQHRPAAALADFQAVGDLLESIGCRNPAVSRSWRSAAALAYLELGDRDHAWRLAREELPLARTWGAPSFIGEALRTLGLIEGGAQGIELLRQSVEVLRGSEAGYELLHSQIELGAALRRANQRAAARNLLQPCLEQAQRTGAGLLAARAHSELLATGARPRRLVMTGIDSLTGSERRVATMAAEGRTNREIAQALFVTTKTVEMHLGHIFGKLEIRSRTELPAALLRTASSSPAA